jgi:hypothetical protein
MTARNSTNEIVTALQYKRWDWAQGNIWKYVNVLRVEEFTDDAIQDMCNATRPLAFKTVRLHAEFCSALGELAHNLERVHGWRNVRFIQTGSSVVGFSTNPLKGVADRPTKITSIESSDVDIVIVAEGLPKWIREKKEEGAKFLGRSYPTTRSPLKSGERVGCKKPEEISQIKEWYEIWSVKLGGGVQVTFDTDENPEIPPWESWVPIPIVKPIQLLGVNGYKNELSAAKAFFCWRWLQFPHAQYRAVTIEDSDTESWVLPPAIKPRDLTGIAGYSNDLAKAFFCWRWVKRGSDSFRAVTLEDVNQDDYQYVNLNPLIRPEHFAGINDYQQDIAGRSFCWRWLPVGGHRYRVLTIE